MAKLYVQPEPEPTGGYMWSLQGDLPCIDEDGRPTTREEHVNGWADTEDAARAAGEAEAARLGVDIEA